MANHSPAPWQLDIPAASGKSCTVRAGDHRTPIAEVLKPGLTYNDAYRGPRYAHEYQANARLIAAAPELLAALKDAILWVNVEDQSAPEYLAKWRAVIAKAEERR